MIRTIIDQSTNCFKWTYCAAACTGERHGRRTAGGCCCPLTCAARRCTCGPSPLCVCSSLSSRPSLQTRRWQRRGRAYRLWPGVGSDRPCLQSWKQVEVEGCMNGCVTPDVDSESAVSFSLQVAEVGIGEEDLVGGVVYGQSSGPVHLRCDDGAGVASVHANPSNV